MVNGNRTGKNLIHYGKITERKLFRDSYCNLDVFFLNIAVVVAFCLCVGCSSSESEEVSDGGGLKNVGRVGSELERNTCTELDAEQILFPESDGEESDWIVNDLEEVQMDVTLELGDADDQQTDTEGCHSVCLAGTTEPVRKIHNYSFIILLYMYMYNYVPV